MSPAFSTNTWRERILLSIFPSAIVISIYSLLCAAPIQKRNAGLELDLRRTQLTAVTPEAAEVSRKLLVREQDGLERIRKRVGQSKQQMRELSQGWRSPITQMETLERISELMRESNLSIVSQAKGDEAVVSQYNQKLFQLVDKHSPDNPVEFWKVEIKGDYFDVVDFLSAVAEKAQTIVPVGLTMKSDTNDSTRKQWTIVFAI